MEREVCYFLPEDFQALNSKIAAMTERIRDIGQEMGLSCQEGAETFHDNFAYEDGERQQAMWSRRLRELLDLRRRARLSSPPDGRRHRVGIGCMVTVRDDGGVVHRVGIGSYMVFNGSDTISYRSPLGNLLLGAQVGEVREGKLGRERKVFEVLAIE